MRKVIYAMSVSLDGFFEGPNGDLSWSYPDDELHVKIDLQLVETRTFGSGVVLLRYRRAGTRV